MLQALAHDVRGDRPHAVAGLAAALASAPEPDGHVRLLLDEGVPLLSLLRDLEQHGHPPAPLLRTHAAGGAAGADAPQPPPTSATSLSARELQVLRLLTSELTGPEIARELFVSPNTLRSHTKHIFTKLDVTNRRAAVLRAREQGLI